MEKYNTYFGINPSNGMNYLFPNVNANYVMETALLSELNKPANWKIDSGATKHFSDGYGTCQIGDFTLKEVWYVPAFKEIRLLSVAVLNKDGIKVIFENSIAIAKKNWKVTFKAPLTDGLFQLMVDAVALNTISFPFQI
ncbi:hypothetical protein K3495_g8478 [Podosphaera aphanis]|nr:hypothetical protein K3495_g8478 [Podosphaera aphanis]